MSYTLITIDCSFSYYVNHLNSDYQLKEVPKLK